MNKQTIIDFHPDLCVQCNACQTACENWNNIGKDISLRGISIQWEGQFPDMKMIPQLLGCRHCIEPECVNACPVKAIVIDEVSQAVKTIPELCVGCGACKKACPYDAPVIIDSKMYKCTICDTPMCSLSCPSGALVIH